jgi:hypothetical protein
MTNLHKNLTSFLLGSMFAYLSGWLSGVAAAMPIPEILQPYNNFVVSYYSNILIVLSTTILVSIIMFVVRTLFTLFSKQNLFYFALPVVLFLGYLLAFWGFAASQFVYAVIPTLLIATLFASSTDKRAQII